MKGIRPQELSFPLWKPGVTFFSDGWKDWFLDTHTTFNSAVSNL